MAVTERRGPVVDPLASMDEPLACGQDPTLVALHGCDRADCARRLTVEVVATCDR